MQTISVGELKARFSEVLERVRKGEKIIISYGKRRKKVAVLLPYTHDSLGMGRKIGLLKDKATCVIGENFKLSDEEMISS